MKKRIKSSPISSLEEEGIITPQTVNVFLRTQGTLQTDEECILCCYFNGTLVFESPWQSEATYEIDRLPVNLLHPEEQRLLADCPLIVILRAINTGGKAPKETDPLMHPDNRAGVSVDLFPLLLGEDQVYLGAYLVFLNTGKLCGCKVTVFSSCTATIEKFQVPLSMTLISAHCLPTVKDGTVMLAAIGLDGITENVSFNFGMSLSSPEAKNTVWVLANNSGYLSNMDYILTSDDKFIPEDLELKNHKGCSEYYWNAMKRVLLDPLAFKDRLNSTFLIEMAGVPKTGKLEVRCRYMGFVDAAVLLQPGQNTVTTCVKLYQYREEDLPEGMKPLLQLPPVSAKASAREKDVVEIVDEHGHTAYAVIRFDIPEPLVPKPKLPALYKRIGISESDEIAIPTDGLNVDLPPKDLDVDHRKIRAGGGALAVHKELSLLASSMKENEQNFAQVKRSAANRLLMKVRTMLKQFSSDGDLTTAEWQDTVTAHHSAARRAVLASFEPRSPSRSLPARAAEARSRMAGDDRIANIHLKTKQDLCPNHPRTILSSVLRSKEEASSDDDVDLITTLRSQCKNRFILWTYAGQEFDKDPDRVEKAAAALRIAVKGDNSAGTSNSIGWAALHALYHHNSDIYASFVGAKETRKAYELPKKFHKFYKNWVEISGEEERFWMPNMIGQENPFIMAAAFFLCLRCYNMTERLLLCAAEGCLSRGSRIGLHSHITTDNYYIRASMYLLQKQFDKALQTVDQGVREFGPSAMMAEMRATCLMRLATEWNDDCARAVTDAEHAGAEINPSLLLQAALFGYKKDPSTALQRAARCHKLAPSAFSALILAKIYDVMGDADLAERWAAAAVKLEPLLSDGWAFLAILALRKRNIDLYRHLFRTAKQMGPITEELITEIESLRKTAGILLLPEMLVGDFCSCTECY